MGIYYLSAHNHGSGEWIPPIVVQIQQFSTSMSIGGVFEVSGVAFLLPVCAVTCFSHPKSKHCIGNHPVSNKETHLQMIDFLMSLVMFSGVFFLQTLHGDFFYAEKKHTPKASCIAKMDRGMG